MYIRTKQTQTIPLLYKPQALRYKEILFKCGYAVNLIPRIYHTEQQN
jgi:hypothetical protein